MGFIWWVGIKIWKKDKAPRKKFYVWSCFLIWLTILALRHPSMGSDLHYGKDFGYIGSFHKLAAFSWPSVLRITQFYNYEKGYILLNKLIATFFENTQFFLFIIALICLAPVFFVIFKRSNNVLLSVIIYLGLPPFVFLYSGLRQSIAIGICFLSIFVIEKRKPFQFFLIILLASFFHSSAWVFLVAYPLFHIRPSKIGRIVSFVLIFIVLEIKRDLFPFLAELFGRTARLDNNNSIHLFLIFLLIYLFCTFFEDKEKSGYLNLFFVACCIQAMAGLNNIISRAGFYYMLPLLISLPACISRSDYRFRYLIEFSIIVCFVFSGLYQIENTSWAMACPYHFFW